MLPLVIVSGAGANSRHSLGTAVFGGMIIATLLSLLVVSVFYVLIERLKEKRVRGLVATNMHRVIPLIIEARMNLHPPTSGCLLIHSIRINQGCISNHHITEMRFLRGIFTKLELERS